MSEQTELDALLTEMEDWGRALLAEHERRICDTHGPVVPSKNTGQSIVHYAERIRDALNRYDIGKSLHGETPWDEGAHRVSDLVRKYADRAANASSRYCRAEDVATDLRALLAPEPNPECPGDCGLCATDYTCQDRRTPPTTDRAADGRDGGAR